MKHYTNVRRTIRKAGHSGGFTLIEIMIVVGIISVLMGAAIFHLVGNQEAAQRTRAKGDIQAITTQLKSYETVTRFLPTTEQGLDALISKPTTEPVPDQWQAFLEEKLKDPWGMEYIYRHPAKKSKKAFDLFSRGPDRIESEDDIGNWN